MIAARPGASAVHPWYLSATPLATLRRLIRLRWGTALVEILAVAGAIALPTRGPGGIVGAAALSGYLLLIYWHTNEIEPEHHELGNFRTHLLNNAFDASVDGQIVRVQVRPSNAGDAVRIEVADEGEGIPLDVLARAGDPFFTTTEAGRGLGLGLFLTRVFAERFGGTLTVQSDRRTTAVLELPRQTEEASVT